MKNCTYVVKAILCICLITAAGISPAISQQIEKGIQVSNGEYLGFLEYKPADYASKTNTKYPLIIFLHGIGERGNGTTELKKVACCGIPRIIKAGHDMNFDWNGKSESFIVISPQCPKSYGMWPNIFVEELIRYAKQNLRIDANRIFLTGLSMGGGGTFKYISTAAEQPKNLAAAATICAPCTFKDGKFVSDAKLPFWGFHAADDLVALSSCTESAVRKINEQNPPVKPLKTIWPTGGHHVWDRVYTDTNYRFQGIVNIYEWFLGQNKSLPVNKLPVANAGSQINITTGTAIATLNGSASKDADGKLVRYVWKKISGPSAGAISNAFSANSTTTVTGLTVAGTYKYELNVVDDRAAFTSDTVTVVVASGVAVENKAPVAMAGVNFSITLPVNTTKLDGSGSFDEDGSIATYTWTKVSGPAVSIVSPNTAITDIKNLVEGTYVFKLKLTDNKGKTGEDQITVTVKPAPVIPNSAPVANAGNDITITLPLNTVSLDGSASHDEDGSISSYTWTKLSGPAANITSGTTAIASATQLLQGTYVFSLKVTDNRGAIDEDQVTVTVKSAPNVAPVARAGADIEITLPDNNTQLNGDGSSDADGSIAEYEWTKLSGPSQFIISAPASANTGITNLAEGTYKFRLQVTDSKGAVDADTVIVKVYPAPPPPNIAPVAQAGANKTITLPVDHVNIDGSSSFDEDGSIENYNWSYINGPESFIIAEPNAVSTEISGLIQGTYTFRLEVKDNDGASSADTIRITVKEAAAPPPPPNVVPVAKAGDDTEITLPLNEVTLDGSASNDEDGTLINYSWFKISGPASYSIDKPNYHVTAIKNLEQGVYLFRLQVKDNDGALGYDTIKVTVNKAPNVRPVSIAGPDQEIQLPESVANISGTDSYDPDGTVVTYLWEQISGPTDATLNDKNSSILSASNLVAGEYKFRLTVTDNEELTASDAITINVLPEPVKTPPVAKAGDDIHVRLPDPSIKFNGSESYDPDGTINSYSWVKINGPGGVTITNSNTTSPSIIGVAEGMYEFRLTVTDNDGLTASDIIKVFVNAEVVGPVINQPPTAYAGPDQTVSFPESTVIVDGSNSTDPENTISAYEWRQISGPSIASVSNPYAVSTSISQLETGEYSFELYIVDDKGESSRDTINISVINTMRYQEQLTIYPNPARATLNVQLTSDTLGDTRITIYNASGMVLKAYNTEKSQAQLFSNIDVANLQSGIYYLEVIVAGKQRKITKFIKQR